LSILQACGELVELGLTKEKNQSKAQGAKSKNLLFSNFFISFQITIYKFIASEKSLILAPNAHGRPIKGDVFSRNVL